MTPKETRELRGIIAAHPDIAARLLIAGRVLVANVAPHHIGCTADAVAALTPELFGREDERLVVLMLSRRHNLLKVVPLTKGSERYTVVDPMQVFRAALKAGAGAIILAHNHPSGDPSPSQQDRDVTVRIARVGRELGIPLLDHLVFADGAVYSFAEHGEGSLQWAPF